MTAHGNPLGKHGNTSAQIPVPELWVSLMLLGLGSGNWAGVEGDGGVLRWLQCSHKIERLLHKLICN